MQVLKKEAEWSIMKKLIYKFFPKRNYTSIQKVQWFTQTQNTIMVTHMTLK